MKKPTYTEAYTELQKIVEDIENAEINIDDLEAQIKKASELLKICKDKLYKTEENVLKSIEEIKAYKID
jgi:exodeoxyribonuclease VII small subunit